MASARSGQLHDAAFFAGSQAAGAELKLAYAFEQELEIAVIVGDSGLGKTTLLRRFTSRSEAAGHVVVDVFFPQLTADGLLSFIAAELGDAPVSGDRDALVRRISQLVREIAERGLALVIVIDDAHLMSDAATLEALQLLLNLREREDARLTIVMAGQRSLIAKLGRVPAVAQRVGITATLLPLNDEETSAFTRQFLRANGHGEMLIDDEALQSVYPLTGGVPRMIKRLCEMATLVAASGGASEVSLADLRSVAAELPRFGLEAA